MIIKQLLWGSDEQYCFYANGHVDKARFLEAVQPYINREIGVLDGDDQPKEADVEHKWFRCWSPSEARSKGYESGFEEAERDEYPDKASFPVTVVIL